MKYSSWAFKTGLVALLIVNAAALYGHLSAVRGPGAGDLPLAVLPSQVTEWFQDVWNGRNDDAVAETSGVPASVEAPHGSLASEAVVSSAVSFSQGLVVMDDGVGPQGDLFALVTDGLGPSPALATDGLGPSPAGPPPADPPPADLVFDGQRIPAAIRVVGGASVNGSGSRASNPASQETPSSGGSPREAIGDVPLDGWVGTQAPSSEGGSSGDEMEQGLVALEADDGLSDESVPAVEESAQKAASPETEKVTPAASTKAAKKATQAKKAAPKVTKKAPAPAAQKTTPTVAKKAPAPPKAAPKKAPAPPKAAPKVTKKAPAPAAQKTTPTVAKKAPAPQKTPAVKAKPNKPTPKSQPAAKKASPAEKKPKQPAKAEPAGAAKQQPAAAERADGESENGPAANQAKKK